MLRVAIHVVFASTLEQVRACHAGVSLITLKPMLWSAKPRLKMMWWVPVTQIVPCGLRMRHASFSHLTLDR